jgi:hypothetical protein
MSDDPMRARMAAAIAEDLGVSVEDASRAMHAAWEATKDDETGTPPSWQPDLSNPGEALARRVQAALEREFSGEELFPVVVVVQARTGHIGLAVTDLDFGGVEQLLMLGRGAARRSLRQHGQ